MIADSDDQGGGAREPLNLAPQPQPTAAAETALPGKLPVVYACSGCSDAGELADRAARALSETGAAEMSCLAGIAGRVKSLTSKAEKAEKILVIDGCPLNCARKTLELAGFSHFTHLELHRLGYRKGACPPTAERIAALTRAATQLLQNTTTNPPSGRANAVAKLHTGIPSARPA